MRFLDYSIRILASIKNAANETLAVRGGGAGSQCPSTAGWNELVKPYKEDSKF